MNIAKIETFPLRIPFKPGAGHANSQSAPVRSAIILAGVH